MRLYQPNLTKTNQFLSDVLDSLQEISNLMSNRSLTDCLSQSLCYYDNYRNKGGSQTDKR